MSGKRSYKQYMPVSEMTTGKLKRLAAKYETKVAVRNRAPRIKGAIAPSFELKYTDTTGAYALDTTGAVTPLNLLAVGDDNTTRDGRQVTIKSVQLRGWAYPADSNVSSQKCRVLIVWDNAVNGALPTVADILTVSSANSFPLVNNAHRFTIIWDKSFVIGQVSDTATQSFAVSPGIIDLEYYKRLNAVTQYSGTTAAIGSIQNGALYMVTIGVQAAAAGAVAQVVTRVRFTDN